MNLRLMEAEIKRLASLSSKFHWVGIYVLKGDRLELGPFVGESTTHTSIKVGEGVCGTAVAQNQDQNISDVTQVQNYLSCSPKTKSELVVLIRDKVGSVVGQIDIDSHLPGAFGEEEENLVQSVAKELGLKWNE